MAQKQHRGIAGKTCLFLCSLTLAGVFLSGGCATIGHDFADREVARIQIGKTTQNDILAMFGSPWRVGVDDGKKTWTYGNYHYSLFNDAKTKDLVVRFDDKGLVTSFTYNTTEHPE